MMPSGLDKYYAHPSKPCNNWWIHIHLLQRNCREQDSWYISSSIIDLGLQFSCRSCPTRRFVLHNTSHNDVDWLGLYQQVGLYGGA